MKLHKYANIRGTHRFLPVGIETSGVFARETMIFFKELGRKIDEECREEETFPYLLQRISMAIHCGNAGLYWFPGHLQLLSFIVIILLFI